MITWNDPERDIYGWRLWQCNCRRRGFVVIVRMSLCTRKHAVEVYSRKLAAEEGRLKVALYNALRDVPLEDPDLMKEVTETVLTMEGWV